MKPFFAAGLIATLVGAATGTPPGDPRPSILSIEGRSAGVQVDLAGGVIRDFHLTGDGVNPLRGMGHFLCLDRWGPPSAAEARNGMPFHGEASRVVWQLSQPLRRVGPAVEVEMTATLPLAGLDLRRRVRLAEDAAELTVRETVTNRNKLGRIFNMVQHPTIGPPFLDAQTVVDAGAGRGLMQSSPLPDPERDEVRWPYAKHNGRRVDVRRLGADHHPNVVSYEVRGVWGWTSALAPVQQRLIVYVWRRPDYPWFSAWRHAENGKPALRGLEFGTTGLHQPFPVLVAKGRIFDLPLYSYLDAGESAVREYSALLVRTPAGFEGVKGVDVSPSGYVVWGRDGSTRLQLPRLSEEQ